MTQHRQPDPLDGLLRHALQRDAGAGLCPAPDVLAAYFERTLPHAEAARHELHFSSCTHCQQQLAALARIESVVGTHVGGAASPAPGFSFLNLRWLAPAALAAAGAVAIWVVVQPGVTPDGAAPQIAAKRQAPADSPRANAPAEAAGAASPADSFKNSAASPRADGKLSARAQNESDAVGQRAKAKSDVAPPAAAVGRAHANAAQLSQPAAPTADARDTMEKKKEVAAAPPVAASEYALKRPVEIASADRAESAKLAEKQEAASVIEAEKSQKSRELAAQSLSAGVQQQRPAGQDASGPKAPAPSQQLAPAMRAGALADESSLRKSTEDARRRQEAPRRVGEGAPTAEQRAKLEVRPEFSILSGRIQWRFYKSGIIERYDERVKGGDTARSPVEQELLHASAPSEKICWAVGIGGVILRTDSAGVWQRLGSPTDEDIVFIEARDADNATIRTRSGKTFVTSNAARSWRTP